MNMQKTKHAQDIDAAIEYFEANQGEFSREQAAALSKRIKEGKIHDFFARFKAFKRANELSFKDDPDRVTKYIEKMRAAYNSKATSKYRKKPFFIAVSDDVRVFGNKTVRIKRPRTVLGGTWLLASKGVNNLLKSGLQFVAMVPDNPEVFKSAYRADNTSFDDNMSNIQANIANYHGRKQLEEETARAQTREEKLLDMLERQGIKIEGDELILPEEAQTKTTKSKGK